MKHTQRPHGVVLVLVALMLPVIFGFAMLVVDLGYLWTVRNQLQNTADAAALAGAQVLLSKGRAEAEIAARDYVQRNPVQGRTADATIAFGTWDSERSPQFATGGDDPNAVQVIAHTNEQLFFARFFHIRNTDVAATGVASQSQFAAQIAAQSSRIRGNIMLVLDRTGSMEFVTKEGPTRREGLVQATKEFLKMLGPGTKSSRAVGVVSFANYYEGDFFNDPTTESTLDVRLSRDIKEAERAVSTMQFAGGTCTMCGLIEAMKANQPQTAKPGNWVKNGRPIYIVISDGEANFLPLDPQKNPTGTTDCPVDPKVAASCWKTVLPPIPQAPMGYAGCYPDKAEPPAVCVADQIKAMGDPKKKTQPIIFSIHYGNSDGQSLMRKIASDECPNKFDGDPDKKCFWHAAQPSDLKQILKKIGGSVLIGLVK